MSELKAYNVVATADVNPEVVDNLGCVEWVGYDKDEVDKEIAELKSEIADLRDDKKLTDAILDERNAEVAKLQSMLYERNKVQQKS